MRTRISAITLLLIASLFILSPPAACQDSTAPAPAPSVSAEVTAPVPPPADVAAPAEPPAPTAEVKPAEPTAPAAEVAPAPVAPAAPALAVKITKPEVATINPDTNIFKRTPKIDGVVDDGEWDVFYTYTEGDLTVTTYADWDDSNLYIAAKSSKPVDLMAFLDGFADGWYNGEDNYEFRVLRGDGNSMKLDVNRYDSHKAKSPAASPVTPDEAAVVEMKSSVVDGQSSIEMCIPAALVRKLKLTDGRKIGLLITARTASDEAGWIDSGSPGNARESTLVSKKMASLKPLDLGFDLRDTRIARGEELVGKFHITNAGVDTVDVRSFVIAGEGKAGNYLSSQNVRMEGLASRKHTSHEIRSIIPSDMPLGSWAIGAEVKSADGKLGGALVSFDVVEPFEAELRLPDKPVKATVKDVTIGVVIRNNARGRCRGDAKITLPAGWELWKNADKRDFSTGGEAVTSVTFQTKPPIGALGDIPVKVDVTVNGETTTIEGKFTVVAE